MRLSGLFSILVGLTILEDPGLAALSQPHAATPQSAAVSPSSYVERIPTTTVSFEMILVPGGTFEMGSPSGEPGREEDEGPRHSVTVGAFWIGRHEVTWDEYDRFAFGANIEPPAGSSLPREIVTRPTPPYGDESFGFGKGRQPVINVTHHAAMEYTRWLSQATGKAYRLATEAASGMTTDALATAVKVLGVERGLAVVEDTEGAAALVVEETGGRIRQFPSKRWPR